MNKKLIAAAVATACVAGAPAAQAEIKTYAQVQFEIANIDVDGSDSVTRVTDQQRGRLGVKGGHDLGGGLKSFAIAEFDFDGNGRDVDFGGKTERNAFRIREVNAGLKGSFGSIGLGTVKSAYKYYGGVKYDPFVTTTLEARGDGMTGGTGGHNGFLNNALVYMGKFGITSLHITYSPDDTDRDGDGQGDDGELSAGIKFGKKTWEAGLAYYDEGVSIANTNLTNTKVFGKMSFGNHTILGQIEKSDSGAATNSETQYIWLGYQLKLGKGMLNAQYAEVDPDGNNNDHTMITLGYIHKLNKQSRVFAGYQTVDYDAGAGTADKDTISVGIRVDI
ncbi:MAG: porin [Thioalkalispiraceae bacterium]|jgi:predicted porin